MIIPEKELQKIGKKIHTYTHTHAVSGQPDAHAGCRTNTNVSNYDTVHANYK
jgi:hypothetical protein